MCWKQHPAKLQLHGHLPPISQTIQARRRHTGHCLRSKDELLSKVLLWAPVHECTSENLYSSALCWHWTLSRGPAKSDWQLGQTVWESQEENPHYHHDLMVMIYIYIYICSYSVAYIYILDTYQCNDNRRSNKRRMKKGRKKTSLEKYSPLTLLQEFERVIQGLHVRGCWRPNINFIFWRHCYDRHVMSFLFSWCWGLLHRGVFWGPPRSGVAFPTTSRL